jgi:hypothetical protein
MFLCSSPTLPCAQTCSSATWATIPLKASARQAWNSTGNTYSSTARLGQSGPLTGLQLFIKVNATLAEFGQDQVDIMKTLIPFLREVAAALLRFVAACYRETPRPVRFRILIMAAFLGCAAEVLGVSKLMSSGCSSPVERCFWIASRSRAGESVSFGAVFYTPVFLFEIRRLENRRLLRRFWLQRLLMS